mmetsp:Transcript_30247/g.90051  ORF Transcript_30247/g.90051 Transcript_30247/m.90051 type:complete len:206 (+) Transcript_30247:1022-1639(+)
MFLPVATSEPSSLSAMADATSTDRDDGARTAALSPPPSIPLVFLACAKSGGSDDKDDAEVEVAANPLQFLSMAFLEPFSSSTIAIAAPGYRDEDNDASAAAPTPTPLLLLLTFVESFSSARTAGGTSGGRDDDEEVKEAAPAPSLAPVPRFTPSRNNGKEARAAAQAAEPSLPSLTSSEVSKYLRDEDDNEARAVASTLLSFFTS